LIPDSDVAEGTSCCALLIALFPAVIVFAWALAHVKHNSVLIPDSGNAFYAILIALLASALLK
jgi:hypothetical protein